MRTLAKTLAVIVAMTGLATAQEKATKPDIVDSAGEGTYAQLKGNRPGEEREFEIAPGVMMTFSWCPPGEFMMGSPPSEEGRESREDQAKVTLSKGFWISKTEVTQSQWAAVFGDNYKCGLATIRIPGWFCKLGYCEVFVLDFFAVSTRKLGTFSSMITL